MAPFYRENITDLITTVSSPKQNVNSNSIPLARNGLITKPEPTTGTLTSSSQTPKTPTSPYVVNAPSPIHYDKIADVKNYEDRSDSGVAAMLSRFRNLVALSALGKKDGQKDDGTAATKEVAAAHALSMEVESAALVTAAEDLLRLTRELKELWLFGPLRGIGEGEGEGKMDEDSVKVGELVEAMLRKDAASANSNLGS